jgi:hypothetical protein
VALPESAVGRVDSAELRVHRSDGGVRAWRLSVRDSLLEADVDGLPGGLSEFEVGAYAHGRLAYYGKAAWDPGQAGSAGITITLGRVGRVRMDAVFAAGMD